MRLLPATCCLLLLTAVGPLASAQERPPAERAADPLPRATMREVMRLYEGPHALRVFERTEIAATQTVEGNVSVIDGPLILAGRVNGRVLAINSDVVLRPGARITGDLLVVGGDIEGEREAEIGGEIRVYRQQLRHTREGDRIVVAEPPRDPEEDSWWRRWERRRSSAGGSRFAIASAGGYNRVEGMPVNVGPALHFRRGVMDLRADAFAVLRTGSSFRGDPNDVGHDLRIEATRGRDVGARIGARAFNVNVPVEDWQLSPLEYGLSAFLFRRDYLDLYGRHGSSAYLSLFDEALGHFTLEYSHERWSPRESVEPWTLFRRDEQWRPNPRLDAARLHVVSGSARFDTRNDTDRPWAGWYVQADLERGAGDLFGPGLTPPGVRVAPGGATSYTRGFLDARRYNRVGPGAQLNFRLVTGGWLGGDPLPLQRRLSVSGAGALPGFDFRTPIDVAGDPGTCAVGGAVPGNPALCERIALAQVEYRGDLHFDMFGGFDWRRDDLHFRSDPVWVAFADAGRGWLLGPQRDGMHYGSSDFPSPATFRTDLGVGLDFGEFGVFVAKSVSDGDEPLNFLFRLRHRF